MQRQGLSVSANLLAMGCTILRVLNVSARAHAECRVDVDIQLPIDRKPTSPVGGFACRCLCDMLLGRAPFCDRSRLVLYLDVIQSFKCDICPPGALVCFSFWLGVRLSIQDSDHLVFLGEPNIRNRRWLNSAATVLLPVLDADPKALSKSDTHTTIVLCYG